VLRRAVRTGQTYLGGSLAGLCQFNGDVAPALQYRNQ
jgi:hypothetical protein